MDDIRLYLVFEFVPMDLKKFIDSRPKKHLDEVLTKSFAYQVNFETCLQTFVKLFTKLLTILLCTDYVIVVGGYILLSCKANIA